MLAIKDIFKSSIIPNDLARVAILFRALHGRHYIFKYNSFTDEILYSDLDYNANVYYSYTKSIQDALSNLEGYGITNLETFDPAWIKII